MFVGKLYRRLHLCIVSRLLDIASNNSMSIYCTRMLVASYVLGLYQADRTVYRPIGDDEIGNNYPTLCVTCIIICFSRRFRVRCKASKGFCFLIVFIKSCPFGANNISIGATNNQSLSIPMITTFCKHPHPENKTHFVSCVRMNRLFCFSDVNGKFTIYLPFRIRSQIEK